MTHPSVLLPARPRLGRAIALFLLVCCAACSTPAEIFDSVEITVEQLPQGAPGVPYSATLTAVGGDGTYAWDVAAGSLPTGLSLESSGVIAGTPSASGISWFTASVTTGDQQTADVPLVLEVSAGPTLLAPAIGATLDNGCSFDAGNPIRWDFDWQDVAGASEYRIEVVGPSASVSLIDAVIAESAYRFEDVGGYVADQNRIGWRWRVQARVAGDWGEWSVERIFDVERNNHDCP